MKTRFERRARLGRPVGSGRALRGQTSSWRVLSPSCLTAGFASWRGTSRCVGATTQLDHTRTHIREARVGFETPPATRGQAQGRAVQLAGSSARANPDPPATSVERASSRKQRARGPGNAGRTRARDASGAFGAVDFEAKVASRRSEARRTRGRFRRRAIPRARASVEAVSREGFVCDRLRHHEAAGALEDAQAVHDYQEP